MCWLAEATLQGQGRRAGVGRVNAPRHALTRPPSHRGPHPNRAQLHEALQLLRGNIRVLVRVRPELPNPRPELDRVGSDSVISFRMPGALTISPPERRIADFEFDTVLGPASTQARALHISETPALCHHAPCATPQVRARAGRRVRGGRAAGALCAGRLQRLHLCVWPDGQARARAAPFNHHKAAGYAARTRAPSICGALLVHGTADPRSGARTAARRTRCRARLTTQVRARLLAQAAVLALRPCHCADAEAPPRGCFAGLSARALEMLFAALQAEAGGAARAPREMTVAMLEVGHMRTAVRDPRSSAAQSCLSECTLRGRPHRCTTRRCGICWRLPAARRGRWRSLRSPRAPCRQVRVRAGWPVPASAQAARA